MLYFYLIFYRPIGYELNGDGFLLNFEQLKALQ